jgi:hypothetical protein
LKNGTTHNSTINAAINANTWLPLGPAFGKLVIT